MSGTATLYALATFVCLHSGTGYETCVPYTVKGFASQRPEQRGGKLKLLVRFADAAKYDTTFKWDDTIESYIRAADLQKMYSSEITHALRKLNGD